MALTLVVAEVTLVLLAVFPFEQAFAVHFILLPLAVVYLSVWPDVLAYARNFILVEVTGVGAAVGKLKNSVSVFLTVFVVAIILGSIWPGLDAVSVLLVFKPVPNICGSIRMFVSPMTVGLVVEPHSLVDVSISMHKGTHAVGLIILPHAIVSGAIGPDLHSTAMLLPIESLTSINGPVSERCGPRVGVDPIVLFVAFVRLHLGIVIHAHLALLGHVVDLELAASLIDVGDSSLSSFSCTVSLLDSDFLFVLFSLRHTIPCTISHLF